MDTKALLYGLIGFFIGGLLVSVAATTFDAPTNSDGDMSMSAMTQSLEGKSGDDYDKAFIGHMIAHHQSAVEMAKLSATRAKHQEIRDLSSVIITAQEKEIAEMKQWQTDWGYTDSLDHSSH